MVAGSDTAHQFPVILIAGDEIGIEIETRRVENHGGERERFRDVFGLAVVGSELDSEGRRGRHTVGAMKKIYRKVRHNAAVNKHARFGRRRLEVGILFP